MDFIKKINPIEREIKPSDLKKKLRLQRKPKEVANQECQATSSAIQTAELMEFVTL